MKARFALLSGSENGQGTLTLKGARLVSLRPGARCGDGCSGSFRVPRSSRRVVATVECPTLRPGPEPPLATVTCHSGTFSFFIRDVRADWPIVLPDFGVAVTSADDKRSYQDIETALLNAGILTNLQKIDREPEESFENAARFTRDLKCPIWLGLSRDVRIFELGFEYEGQWDDYVTPKLHHKQLTLPEHDSGPVQYNFMVGRGVGVTRNITRRLEEGWLPILNTRVVDEDVRYDCTAFVAFERRKLTARALRGTHFLAADAFSWGARQALGAEDQAALIAREIDHSDEPTLFFRATAVNTAAAPRYAWFKSVVAGKAATWSPDAKSMDGRFPSGRVFAVSKVNGLPMPQEEMAVLLAPGETCEFEFAVPHSPVPPARARAPARVSFDGRLAECRRFWKLRLSGAAGITLPEKRIEEMLRAGLVHLDIITFGNEPAGPLAACVGRYAPIGSESSQIIQFHDSMGRHDVAARAIQYFLDKQREDGFIQNYENIMIETGPTLWTIAEHFRYTRNRAWAARVTPNVIKACDYVVAWSERNRTPERRGRGYGLLEGKVGDPEDNFRLFMLNGYAYLGLARSAELLYELGHPAAGRIASEARAFKALLLKSVRETVERSPVVPLGDGTWCPAMPPWAEGTGPASLYAEKRNAYTHGTFVARDSIIGAMYLIYTEVLGLHDSQAEWLVKYHSELLVQRNAAFSEPYYSIHPWVHLARGEVKAFLKAYYNTVSALADKETYTFWEHLFHASVHKVSEEAQSLMQTRAMLWMERSDALMLLPGVPRAWLAEGKEIRLERVASYFGHVSLCVKSTGRAIEARVECTSRRRPATVTVRLPHPDGRFPKRVNGGIYDQATETLTAKPFGGRARATLSF